MARVVQRRSNPPYLLIIFVFTTMVATTLFVMKQMKSDELGKQLDKAKQSLSAKISDGRKSSTQYEALVGKIVGQDMVHDDVMKKIEDIFADGEDHIPLLDKIDAMKISIEAKDAALAASDALVAQRDAELADARKIQETIAVELGRQIKSVEAQLTAIQVQLQQEQQSHAALRDEAKIETDRKIDSRNKRLAKETDASRKLQMGILRHKLEISKLKSRISDLEGGQDDAGAELTIKVAGTIMEDPTDDDACFIDLGKRDGVKPGWTFAIYPRTETPKSSNRKGTLLVKIVRDGVSECKITQTIGDSPVAKNDKIANLAFDPDRVFTFVVEGNFDLRGTNNPTPDGAEQVKILLKSYGAKIATEVGINTDFVVLGHEAPLPSKPRADATPSQRALYNAKLARYNRYSDIKRSAVGLRIPILNTNSFLDHIGRMPVNTLSRN